MKIPQQKTREELERDACLQPGTYPFEVSKADESVSKKGTDMFAIEITVYDNDNHARKLKDWLGLWQGGELKMLDFVEAVGLTDKWATGELKAIDMLGMSGYVRTNIKNDPNFGARAQVQKYVPTPKDAVKREPAAVFTPSVNDADLPF